MLNGYNVCEYSLAVEDRKQSTISVTVEWLGKS